MINKYVKVSKAASFLQCSKSQIYAMVHDGRLKSIRLGERGLRIEENSLNKYTNKVDNEIVMDQHNGKAVVYFIQAETGGLIKIGHAMNINQRFKTIQNQCPVKLQLLTTISTTEVSEQEMHEKFAPYRQHGEWFEPSIELVTFISKNKD